MGILWRREKKRHWDFFWDFLNNFFRDHQIKAFDFFLVRNNIETLFGFLECVLKAPAEYSRVALPQEGVVAVQARFAESGFVQFSASVPGSKAATGLRKSKALLSVSKQLEHLGMLVLSLKQRLDRNDVLDAPMATADVPYQLRPWHQRLLWMWAGRLPLTYVRLVLIRSCQLFVTSLMSMSDAKKRLQLLQLRRKILMTRRELVFGQFFNVCDFFLSVASSGFNLFFFWVRWSSWLYQLLPFDHNGLIVFLGCQSCLTSFVCCS